MINYGTAGNLNKKLKGLVEVTQFFQRDMDASPLGFKIGQTPFDEIEEINLAQLDTAVAQAILLLLRPQN